MFQILIVEDDKELSQLFQKVLEKNGYQVKSASDGAQALEVLDKEYIENWDIGLDIKILLKTVGVVLKKDGSM